jgi:PAS domain S-box-containing protein
VSNGVATTVPVDESALAGFAAQHCPDMMVVVDPAGSVRFASDSVRRVLGFAPDDHVGSAIWDFVHPDDLVAAAGAVSEASRSTGYHQPAVFRIRHNDGHWIECEVNGLTVEGEAGDGTDGAWLVLAIRATGDRDELMGRRRRIEQLIRMASLECSSVPWDDVDALVERYLQDLAGVVGAELVELAWEESDADLRIGARWPVVRMTSVASAQWEPFEPLWPLEQTAAQLLCFTTDIDDLPDSPARDRLVALRSQAVVEVPLSPRAPWAVARLAFGPQWRKWDDANVDLVVVLASTLMATLRRCLAEAHLHQQARTDPLTGLMNRAELYRQFDTTLRRHDRDAAGSGLADLGVCTATWTTSSTSTTATGTPPVISCWSTSGCPAGNTRENDLIARPEEFVLVPDLRRRDAVEHHGGLPVLAHCAAAERRSGDGPPGPGCRRAHPSRRRGDVPGQARRPPLRRSSGHRRPRHRLTSAAVCCSNRAGACRSAQRSLARRCSCSSRVWRSSPSCVRPSRTRCWCSNRATSLVT